MRQQEHGKLLQKPIAALALQRPVMKSNELKIFVMVKGTNDGRAENGGSQRNFLI